jgi:hypothetical protein
MSDAKDVLADDLAEGSVEDEPGAPDETDEEPEPTDDRREPRDTEPTEPEPSRADELDELRLRVRKAENEARKLEFLLGSKAGEAGHLRQMLRQRMAATETGQQETEDDDEPPEQTTSRARRRDPRIERLERRLELFEASDRERGVQQAVTEFCADQPEGRLDVDTLRNLVPRVQAEIERYAGLELTAKQHYRLARMALDTALMDLDLERLRAKKASQVDELRKRKITSTSSGVGSTGTRKPKPKSPEEATLEEIDQELIRRAGRRGG